MSIKENVASMVERAKEGAQNIWNEYKVQIVVGGAALGAAIVYACGVRDGRAIGWLQGWETCNATIATTLKEHDSELFEKADDIIEAHGIETLKRLTGQE